MSDYGKGDTYRKVDGDKYRENYERIFAKSIKKSAKNKALKNNEYDGRLSTKVKPKHKSNRQERQEAKKQLRGEQ